MKSRLFGNSTIEISELGLGCMSFSDSVAENKSIVHSALDNGINYFDTANIYQNGNNESTLGKLLENQRHKVVIGTKVGHVWHPNKQGWYWDANPKTIKDTITRSLQHLKTDYIDFCMLHGGTMEDNFEAIQNTLNSCKKEGKIREYGISSIRPNTIAKFIDSDAKAVMTQFNLLDRRPECEIVPLLKMQKKGVLIHGAFAKGMLVHKPIQTYLQQDKKDIEQLLYKVKEQFPGIPLPTLALAFVLNQNWVTSAVIGVSTRTQLDTNLKIHAELSNSALKTEVLNDLLPLQNYLEHTIHSAI